MDMGESAALKIDIHKKQETKKKVKQKGGILEMKKKSKVAKVLALCLAMVMMLSMSMTVFADVNIETNTGTVTVTGMTTDNGAQINAYKVININFDNDQQQPEEPVYVWTDEMATWFAGGGAEYVAYIGENNEVTNAYMNLTADQLGNFYAAVRDAGILETPDATGTIVNETATLTSLTVGEYLVLATKDSYMYQPMTAKVDIVYNQQDGWVIENANIVLKGSVPGIDKEVPGGDQTVEIGDTVPYKLTVDIPSYPENATVTKFEIGDRLSTGLTLDTGSIKIFIGNETTELPASYYQLDTVTANSFTFDLTNSYGDLKTDYPNAEKVYVTYNATVNGNAFAENALGNSAFIGYTNDPYTDSNSTTDVEETVYTYGIDVTKYIKGENVTLPGAVFQLSNADGVMSFVSLGNGVYRPAKDSSETNLTTDLEVSSAGKLVIQGIDLGVYTLKETAAPNGYVCPEEGITITLVDDNANGNPNGTLDEGDSTAAGTTIREGSVSITGKILNLGVDNTNYEDAGLQLPKTGGMGTLIFTIAGIILMAGAVTMITVIARKKKA